MDWQARYEAGDTPWDKGEAHPALADYIGEAGEFAGRILVPGCGPGHDVRDISTHANEVIGLDIAPLAIEGAQKFPKAGREEYRLLDLFDLPAGFRQSFDWVVEDTCFCAIDPAMRPAYAEAVAGALKPGGYMFAIFYLNPDHESGPPHGVSVAELEELFSPHFTLLSEWVPARTFKGREGRELVRLLQRL